MCIFDMQAGDIAEFLQSINPLAQEVGISMLNITLRLRSILQQTITRGGLGMDYILAAVLGTVSTYNLDAISSKYASDQYLVNTLYGIECRMGHPTERCCAQGCIILLSTSTAVAGLLLISVLWNHEAGANICGFLLTVIFVEAMAASYVEGHFLRSGNDLCANLDPTIADNLLEDAIGDKGRTHVTNC